MTHLKVGWNKDRSASVVLSKIKEFTIPELSGSPNYTGTCHVHGWYNKENFFNFGTFNSPMEARKFLQEIHDSM